jgi:hypothetical protein
MDRCGRIKAISGQQSTELEPFAFRTRLQFSATNEGGGQNSIAQNSIAIERACLAKTDQGWQL